MKTVKVLSLMLLGVVAICVIVALAITPITYPVGFIGLSSMAGTVTIHREIVHLVRSEGYDA